MTSLWTDPSAMSAFPSSPVGSSKLCTFKSPAMSSSPRSLLVETHHDMAAATARPGSETGRY